MCYPNFTVSKFVTISIFMKRNLLFLHSPQSFFSLRKESNSQLPLLNIRKLLLYGLQMPQPQKSYVTLCDGLGPWTIMTFCEKGRRDGGSTRVGMYSQNSLTQCLIPREGWPKTFDLLMKNKIDGEHAYYIEHPTKGQWRTIMPLQDTNLYNRILGHSFTLDQIVLNTPHFFQECKSNEFFSKSGGRTAVFGRVQKKLFRRAAIFGRVQKNFFVGQAAAPARF